MADLTGAKFIGCELAGARFDNAKLENTVWENCHGLADLDTEPDSYEQIADAVAIQWQNTEHSKQNWDSDAKEALYKAYKTIVDLHEKNGTLTDALKEHLISKGQIVRVN